MVERKHSRGPKGGDPRLHTQRPKMLQMGTTMSEALRDLFSIGSYIDWKFNSLIQNKEQGGNLLQVYKL